MPNADCQMPNELPKISPFIRHLAFGIAFPFGILIHRTPRNPFARP
jgi:hypothetical protein